MEALMNAGAKTAATMFALAFGLTAYAAVGAEITRPAKENERTKEDAQKAPVLVLDVPARSAGRMEILSKVVDGGK